MALAPARQHEGTRLERQGREMCEVLCWLEGFFEGRKAVQACPGSQKSLAGRELVSPCTKLVQCLFCRQEDLSRRAGCAREHFKGVWRM